MKKALTLMELMIVLIIAAILMMLAIPAYRNYIEDSKAKVCQSNLKVLSMALNIYVREHDSIPGSFSQIPEKYLNKALVEFYQQKDAWKIRLAHIILGLHKGDFAYAQAGFMNDLVKGSKSILICPADQRNISDKISYGINQQVQGKTAAEYSAIDKTVPIIVDFDATYSNYVFSGSSYAFRHKKCSMLSTSDFGLSANNEGDFLIIYKENNEEKQDNLTPIESGNMDGDSAGSSDAGGNNTTDNTNNNTDSQSGDGHKKKCCDNWLSWKCIKCWWGF